MVHGRVERNDYVVDRVYFESWPGHFVTGSLYRPKNAKGPMPAILSPHGHWKDGRFYDAGEALIATEIASGAESFPYSGRFPIQARAVQLARMGCLVFVYDMIGYADSIQLPHRPDRWKHLDRNQDWGLMSVQADLRLQNSMGLQTWNSIRAVDFVLSLPETDPDRIGVTGASGGGTQSMILAAVDDRISAAMPCVMVSTAMQGGCSCENAPLLRIDQGNVDIAAAIAPKPLGLTAADDWTVELKTKGYPELSSLYKMLGHSDHLIAAFHTEFKHNYNQVNRLVMYGFFNRHFDLNQPDPIREQDFKPLTRDEATVWTNDHPKPSGDQIGESHEIRLLKEITASNNEQLKSLIPVSKSDLEAFREVVGGGWQVIIGRSIDQVGEVVFRQTSEQAEGKTKVRVGEIVHVSQQEILPATIFQPIGPTKAVAIEISDRGKSLEQNDSIRALVQDGIAVITADLLGQGEELSDDNQPASQRYHASGSQDGWRSFSGYTYGYNHSLFASRVHDVLTLIKYANSQNQSVQLRGSGPIAGPIAAAAASQARESLVSVSVDMHGFSFSSVDRHTHPMFVPGAVKYFDIDGVLSLIAPKELHVTGAGPLPVTLRAYESMGKADQLHSRGRSN